MAFNLVDSFKSLITLEVVDKAAAQFDENQGGISKAILGAVPVILTGFVHRANTGDSEAGALLQDAKDAASNNLSNFSDGGSVLSKGKEWLGNMFGDRSDALGNSLSNFAGIKTSSAQSLLAMLAPAGLAVVGKHALDNDLSVDGFRSFLSEQKANIKDAMPEGLNVGLDRWLEKDDRHEEHHAHRATATTPAATTTPHYTEAATAHHTHHPVQRKPRSTNWVLILILLLIAIALIWYFLGRNTDMETNPVTPGDTTASIHTSPVNFQSLNNSTREPVNFGTLITSLPLY